MAPWPSGKAEACKAFIPSSNLGGASRKNSCSKEQEFFQLYSPSASYIELRSVIFASQVIFALRVLKANIISLKPKVSISLSRSENITLCDSTEYH